jgi:hypothetical protein
MTGGRSHHLHRPRLPLYLVENITKSSSTRAPEHTALARAGSAWASGQPRLSLYLFETSGCSGALAAAWQHTQLIIDVVPGRGSGFSAEAPEGVRFLTRSRVFTDEEVAELEAAGPPARAA